MNYQQLDRAKFETAFLEVARRGTTASIFHGLIFVGVLVSTPLGESGIWHYFITFIMFGTSAWRLWILKSARRYVQLGQEIPRFKLQTQLRATAVVVGLGWSIAYLISLSKFGFTMPTLGIYVVLMGFAPASLSLCAMDMFVSGSFISMTSLTVIFTCFLVHDAHVPTHALGFLYIAHLAYNITLVRRYNVTFFETVESQLAVESQKLQLEGILNAVPGYVAWLDQDGVTLGNNRLFVNALTSDGAEVKGLHFENVIGANKKLTGLVARFQEAQIEETVHEVRAIVGGQKRWFILALRKFSTSTGFNTVAVAVDISNEKLAQEELASEKIRASQSERLSLIGAMAGGVAHEINNPLAIIRGRLERLYDLSEAGEITPAQASMLSEKAIQTVDRIARIVRGLRLMARGETSDALTKYNLVDLCRDVMELAASGVRKAEAKIEFVCGEDRLETLCQPTQISQILLNLVQNSLDAIANLKDRWVRISLVQDQGEIIIAVTDSGNLQMIKHPEKIFDPFFTTKTAGEGCGLGLSISQTMARRHGGDLRLDLTSDHTRFVLQLGDGKKKASESEMNALTLGEEKSSVQPSRESSPLKPKITTAA